MFKILAEKYKAAKLSYLNRSPKGKYQFVRAIGWFILKPMGINIFDPNFKVYWLSFVPLLSFIAVAISFFYTIWYNYVRGTLLVGFYMVPMLGVIIPCGFCYFLVMYSPTRAVAMSFLSFIDEKIFTDKDPEINPNYIAACDRSAIKLLKSMSQTLGLVIFSLLVTSLAPIYDFIFKKELNFLFPILFPFTDLESKTGLTINLANQFFICITGSLGNIGIEVGTCVLKNSVWAVSMAICHSIDEISQCIERSEGDTTAYIDPMYRNLLIQVQDYDRYLLRFCDFYYYKFFLQPITLTFAVSLAIFFYLYAGYSSGPGLAILAYIQLFILCDIGSEVDSANKMLVLKFQQMAWYKMSKRNQLSYAHLLNRLQNGTKLRMGPFAELNFETFTDMTNRIYSFLMMLIRLLK